VSFDRNRVESPCDILIASDNSERQLPLAGSLARAGYQPHVATNGLEAIRHFACHAPSLVLLDLHTVIGNATTARLLRTLEVSDRHMPIVAIEPAGDSERASCLSAGADHVVPVPLDFGALHGLLLDLVAQSAEPPQNSSAPTAAAAVRRATAIDLSAALGRLGGDESLLADLIQFFFEDAFGLLATMQKGIAERNWDEARRAAHSLKGLSSNFSATRAVNALQMIEMCDRNGATPTTESSMKEFAAEADEEVLWLAAALAEYCAQACEGAS
jgi:two-component system sensor histidine kinase/response regulator